jgi:hypothetical protein
MEHLRKNSLVMTLALHQEDQRASVTQFHAFPRDGKKDY